MAAEEQKDVLDEGSSSEVQLDGEIFKAEAHKDSPGADIEQSNPGLGRELSEYELFAGDEDFYNILAESSGQKPVEREIPAERPAVERQWSQRLNYSKYKRFSTLQKILAVSILAVVSILLYLLLKSPSGLVAGTAPAPAGELTLPAGRTPVSSASADDSRQLMQAQIQDPESVQPPSQPISLNVARNFYLQKEYKKAFAAYKELHRTLPADEELLRDFLQLKMALCAGQFADFEQAGRLLTMASQSRSPAVRIVGNYNLSLLEIQRKRYLRARTRAYNAIALIKAVDFDDDWALSFECDCSFLVAECLSRHILSLSSIDTDLPADLWGKPVVSSDPFDNLNEAELRRLLSSGSDHLGRGLLDPDIRKLEEPEDLPRFSVSSYGAPVEELLAKFTAGTELDLNWAFNGALGTGSGENAIRQRPVSLYLPAATSRQIVLTAAGCAELLACTEEDSGRQKVTIYDPAEYSSLRQHITFLSQQAVSLWQQFMLTFDGDRRVGNAHLVKGFLQSQTGQPFEAIAEYKLVANRFSQMSLAPFALLHSSKLKASLRDYPGAREDLKQLVEQYPDAEIYGQAYLRLADATMEAGLYAEAAQLYQRVYNFGLSAESKSASAIGAAGCLYETKAYEETVKWLTRYIDLAGSNENKDLYSAYFLLGRSNMAMGDYQQACDAFQYALEAPNSREQYLEAIASLVKGYIEHKRFVEALDTLERVRSVALSEEQSVEMLLLKCRIFRMLGLVDTAIVYLRDKAQFHSNPELNAKIYFEIALCHVSKGNLESARTVLSQILSNAEIGPLAQQTAIELADVCLKLQRGSQAVSVCLQLLETDVSGQQKLQILRMLAEAYNQEKNYDKAILALSGQWK